MKLRNMGAPQDKALKFSKKSFCRYDVTRQKDGPEGHRQMKFKQAK